MQRDRGRKIRTKIVMELGLRGASLQSPKMSCFSLFPSSGGTEQCLKHGISRLSVKAISDSQNPEPGRTSGKQTWRRRRLQKRDKLWEQRERRLPFLEEQVRKIKEDGKLVLADSDLLMKQADNPFEFVMDIAAEATEQLVNNPDAFVTTKPILKVISDRMNDAGYDRPDGYVEDDPFKPSH
eukprot:Gb_37961 [translate_table: standard]